MAVSNQWDVAPLACEVNDVLVRWDKSRLGKPLGDCNNKEIGRLGEEVAARYLQQTGLELIEKNWRCSFGEVDIVCHDGTGLVLAEVKTRLVSQPTDDVAPEIAVNYRKRRKYEKLGLLYLSKQIRFDLVRFDVVAVQLMEQGSARIRHLAGAYEWDR